MIHPVGLNTELGVFDDPFFVECNANLFSSLILIAIAMVSILHTTRVAKSDNFPDSKIFVAKTFRIKRVNRVNFQIRDKCA